MNDFFEITFSNCSGQIEKTVFSSPFGNVLIGDTFSVIQFFFHNAHPNCDILSIKKI